jgi:Fe-Mn family superoxide dismutase
MIARRPAVAAEQPKPYVLPPLSYAPDANEPAIDAETMSLHHDKHHAAYVNNLNSALKDHPDLLGRPLPDLLAHLGDVPEPIRMAVRNNAGGHANHSMFWTLMGGKGGAPDGELAAAIDRDLGGFEAMKAAFGKAGLSVFGSGWVFVTVTRDGKLALVTRPNQDTPLLEGDRVLFGNDVWEHAYYLRYHNVRGDYLKAWWGVVNWPEIAARYDRARAGTLGV